MLPAAVEDDALIEGEEVGNEPSDGRGDREQRAGEVAALADGPVDGRVDAVVVAGGEVEHGVIEALCDIEVSWGEDADREAIE